MVFQVVGVKRQPKLDARIRTGPSHITWCAARAGCQLPRNLDRRVEAVTPIEDSKLRMELQEILRIMLEDNRQAWDLGGDGVYSQRSPQPNEPERSTHEILMKRARLRDG